MKHLLIAIALTTTLAFAGDATGSVISSSVNGEVTDYAYTSRWVNPPGQQNTTPIASYPTEFWNQATRPGVLSRTDVDFGPSALGQDVFQLDVLHDADNCDAKSWGYYEFQVDGSDPYSLGGEWTMVYDDKYWAKYQMGMVNWVRLSNVSLPSDPVTLAYSYHSSRLPTAGTQTHMFGETDGNYQNIVEGSLTGMLGAGETYRVDYYFETHAYVQGGGEGASDGQLSLTVGSPGGVIPEPSTLAIWSLFAVCGLAVVSWRRRK
jgi:hypothetical protein